MKQIKYIAGGFSFLAVGLLGCTVGPDYQSPEGPQVDSYSTHPEAVGKGEDTQTFLQKADIPAQWWHVFQCKALNELINQGISRNNTLNAAQAALRVAQRNFKAEVGTDTYPSVDLDLGYHRQKGSNASSGSDTNPVTFNLYNVAVNVSYTPDVFGASYRKIESALSDVEQQQFTVEATYLTLTANIVTSAITEASLRAQIQATKKVIEAQEEILHLLQEQWKLGAVSRQDVFKQQIQLEQARAMLPPLEYNLAQVRNALAVLVGVLPNQEPTLPTFILEDLHLPKDLPLTIPSQLVRQRPDIRVAEAQLHKASAQVGVATANLYPTLTLTGAFGSQAVESRHLFNSVTTIWSLGTNLLQPIFHGFALTEKKEAAIEGYKQALAQYQQTVLQSFQNVADTLWALEYDAKKFTAQEEAQTHAQSILNITQEQFKLGAVAYGTLLNAQIQYQQAVISKTQAQAARFTDTAALFQALGGGWWNRASIEAKPEQKN